MKNRIGIIQYGFLCNYFEDFLELCRQNNIEVDLFSFEEETETVDFVKNVYHIKTHYSMKDFKSKKKVEEEIKKLVNIENYDYILADTIALSFTCNIFHNHSLRKRIECSEKGIVKSFQIMGHINRLNNEKIYYKNSPKIIAVSDIIKQDLIKNCSIPPERICVAYPGTNNSGNICEKNPSKIFTVGLSACGFATKGGYNLLGALRVLKKKYPQIRIKAKIINPKFKKNSFEDFYTKIFKIDDIVEFLPFQKNINKFYSGLDCFVCASRYEAFGRVVTEAMINGVPVITGSNIGASEIIKDGENGFVFEYDKNKYENLADKIAEVYNKRNSLENLVAEAKTTAEKLSWKNFSQTIFDLLYK